MSWAMHAQTREVLRMISAVGDVGILRTDLRQHFPNDGSLGKRLDNLVENGYVIKRGKYNDSRFFATSKRADEADAAAATPAGDDPEALMRAEARSKTPQGVPPGVPSSIFHLGQMHAAAAGAREAEAAPPAATAPAVAAAPAAAGPFSVAPLVIPTFQPQREAPARATAAPPPPAGTVFKPLTPHFELHSDGVLVIDPAGDGTEPISLPPTLTRHLFRWLDQLSGLHLSRLVAADTEAAS